MCAPVNLGAQANSASGIGSRSQETPPLSSTKLILSAHEALAKTESAGDTCEGWGADMPTIKKPKDITFWRGRNSVSTLH